MSSLFDKQPQQQTTGGLFGSQSATQQLTLQKSQGGLFGSAAPTTSGGGLFGNTQSNTINAPQGSQGQGSLFGGANQASNQIGQATAPLSFGSTGQTQQPTGQAQASLFGKPSAQGTGLFGQQQSTTGGSLFGASSTAQTAGTGLFGNNNQQKQTTGSLFGGGTGSQIGQNTQAVSNTGGLFGGAKTNTTSLFGGGQNQQTTPTGQTTSLFGNTSNTPSALGLLQQQTAGFGFNQQTQQQMTPAFGQTPQQQLQQQQFTLFGQNMQQQQMAAFTPTADPALLSKPFISDFYVEQKEEQERQQYEKEIVHMFQNYSKMLACDPQSAENRFVCTFYNRYPKVLVKNDPHTIKFFKDHVPKTITFKREVVEQVQPQDQAVVTGPPKKVMKDFTVPIQLDLWLKSYQENPNPNELYTTQLNSTRELLERCKQISGNLDEKKPAQNASLDQKDKADQDKNKTEDTQQIGAVEKASLKLEETIKQLQHMSDTQEAVMQDRLQACQQNNVQIRKQMLRIFGKFEKLMHVEGRVSINGQDTQRRDMLIQSQNRLLERINGPTVQSGQGMLTKLRDMQSQLQYSLIHQDSDANNFIDSGALDSDVMHIHDGYQQPLDASFPDADEAEFGQMFKILRKQKRALDTMVDSVNTSTRQLMVMEREMDMLKGA